MANAKTEAVCVTGATGYIGSWLVRSLLSRGYVVHATARDTGKALQLFSSFGANDRLKLFRADLREEGSFDEAVGGCVGLFHVAASMELGPSFEENTDSDDKKLSKLSQQSTEYHVLSQMLEPAVRGTTNLLKSCSRSRTIKRVIFTSSISTITAKDDKGRYMQIVDESSSIPMDPVWKQKPSGWTYILMKCLTEEKAFRFAEMNGIDLISIIPPTVAGPFLTPSVPLSDQVILSPITGDSKLYPILVSVHSRLGSIPLVHIEDICNAHIFLMEKAAARGRYICAAGNCTIPQLTDILASEFPSFNAQRLNIGSFNASACSVISSEKIRDLGFEFRYSIRDILKETVSSCAENGFLNDFL